MVEKEPTERTEKGLDIPVPTHGEWDETLSKVVKPAGQMEEAAAQEAEYPDDETSEG